MTGTGWLFAGVAVALDLGGPPLDDRAFAALVAGLLRAGGCAAEATEPAPAVRVRCAGGSEAAVDLGLAHRRFVDDAAGRDATVRAAVEAARRASAPSGGLDPRTIYPLVREAVWLDAQAVTLARRGDALPHERLGEHLVVVYAAEAGDQRRILTAADLPALGTNAHGLRYLARANLRRAAPAPRARGTDPQQLEGDAEHDAALLLLPESWPGALFPPRGDLYALALAPDLLVVSTEGPAPLRAVAQANAAARSLPVAVLRWSEGGWVDAPALSASGPPPPRAPPPPRPPAPAPSR
jgi:hypothetical protein